MLVVWLDTLCRPDVFASGVSSATEGKMKGARVKAGQSPAELYKGVLCTAKKPLFFGGTQHPLAISKGGGKKEHLFFD